MLAFLTSEAGVSLIGLVVGYFFRYNAERNKAINDRIALRDASMDAAANRGGTWVRRAIIGIVAFVIVSVVMAGFLEVPVVVETEFQRGILFWKKTVREFVTINGVLFPEDIRKAFMLICTFYLGQGVK